MTALDDSLIPGISSLISNLGKNITFFTEANRIYDASTQEVIEDPEVKVTAKVSPPDYIREVVEGKEVQTVNFILAAKDLTFTPDIKMEIEVDSEKYRIFKINLIYSGTSVVAYDITGS